MCDQTPDATIKIVEDTVDLVNKKAEIIESLNMTWMVGNGKKSIFQIQKEFKALIAIGDSVGINRLMPELTEALQDFESRMQDAYHILEKPLPIEDDVCQESHLPIQNE
jgi:hypothetical protein